MKLYMRAFNKWLIQFLQHVDRNTVEIVLVTRTGVYNYILLRRSNDIQRQKCIWSF